MHNMKCKYLDAGMSIKHRKTIWKVCGLEKYSIITCIIEIEAINEQIRFNEMRALFLNSSWH